MRRLLLIIATSFLFTACDKAKEKEIEIESGDIVCLNGTIEWGGEPAADGRGWIFVPTETSQYYSLKDLPAAYKQDDLPVSVCLQQTNEKAPCFCPEPPYFYRVTSVKRR